MFHAELPFVAIDPVGSWWGLRSGRDGARGGGLPIVIFGGEHGDIPLERASGEYIADLVVEKRLSCVLDVSNFPTEADKKKFLLDFARRLYGMNRDPMHLFLEEADDYIPQKPMGDETHLLRAWENIVRRGRARGIGITLITQRSAAVNKMVLTQVETLFALRTTGPQDIKAIGEWVKYNRVDEKLLASLASLSDGDAWVWSPSYLHKIQRIHFRQRSTFDSGATPTNLRGHDGKRVATLADVDLDSIRGAMAATIERAKSEDPKELQKTISALRRELVEAKGQPAPAPPAPTMKIERVEVQVIPADSIQWMEKHLETARVALADAKAHAEQIERMITDARRFNEESRKKESYAARPPSPVNGHRPTNGHAQPSNGAASSEPRRESGATRIMRAVIQAGSNGVTRAAITISTGYSRSTRDRYLSDCSGEGWVTYVGQRVFATADGEKAFAHVPPLPTGDALRAFWLGELPEGQRNIVTFLANANKWIERESIDQALVITRSTRDRYLCDLVTLNLVEKQGTSVRLSPMLFD